jgi:hypothetical protein
MRDTLPVHFTLDLTPFFFFLAKLTSYEASSPRPRPCVTVLNNMEDHPLSIDHGCLFSILTATLHIMRPSSLSSIRGCVVPLWTGHWRVHANLTIIQFCACYK